MNTAAPPADRVSARLSADDDWETHQHAFRFVTQRCWCGMSRYEWMLTKGRLDRMAAGYFG